jgi:hypothetical protein
MGGRWIALLEGRFCKSASALNGAYYVSFLENFIEKIVLYFTVLLSFSSHLSHHFSSHYFSCFCMNNLYTLFSRILGIAAMTCAIAITVFTTHCTNNASTTTDKPSTGRSIFATDGTTLIRFGATSPDVVSRRVSITGLQAGETIVGIDFRAAASPAERMLYGISSANRILTIDTTTGAAMMVGTTGVSVALRGTTAQFGFDFNPMVDRIRLHAVSLQNLRLNPITGGLVAVDSVMAFATNDANAGRTPVVVGTAYTNSVPAATSTILYAIDAGLDILTRLPSPNDGRMQTVGSLGVNTNEFVGFDIAADTGLAYATLTTAQGASGFYTINLSSGAATLVGMVGHMSPLVGIAVVQP